MKKNILIGLMLSGALFVGCGGDKPKEEQKVVEPTAVTTATPTVTETKPEATTPVATTSEPKAFDATSAFASKCSSCHGTKGEGKSIFPKLAGQTKDAIAKKLRGYKDGTFGNDKKAMMIPNVNSLTDDEIEKIAEVVSKF
ncbi:MAG: c-type cytochrome [Arcobacteraceae bacterium]|nr:c-type cytochrome [Arcobacteraceae bacterium]